MSCQVENNEVDVSNGEEQGVPLVSIIIPTYKEAENLAQLIISIGNTFSKLSYGAEIVIVDDDSRDGSFEIVSNLIADGHPVQFITRIGERGLSSAVIRGFQEARGEFFVCMDADLSHPPAAIPKLIAPLLNDPSSVDLVLGSRYVPGASTDANWGILRWLNSKIAIALARLFVAVKDPMSGFFALSRKVLNNTNQLNPIGYKIGLEIMVKCRCEHIVEIPIHFAKRQHGDSKLSFKEQVNYIRHLKRLADFRFGKISRFIQFV